MKIELFKENPDNPRVIEDDRFEMLKKSITEFPRMMRLRPIVVDSNNMVLGGNQRLKALISLGYTEIDDEWVVSAADLSEEEKTRFIIADNVSFGEDDLAKLSEDWDAESLKDWGVDDNTLEQLAEIDVSHLGNVDAGVAPGSDVAQNKQEARAKLTDKFIVPPFSILDTKQGYWQERKKHWRILIEDNGESREGTLSESELMGGINSGVSLLDPVMAEIVNRWFGLPNCKAFDCFAGDSVFGFVADYLGNSFTGVELREEQATLNNERLHGKKSKYICDDGRNVAKHLGKETQDLLFSCPPYFDLEVYSELPNDASNQGSYEDFIAILRDAFTSALSCLKENRFAVIVIGDIRSKSGHYYGFVDDVKEIFKTAGAGLYNELILAETLGTLPQRVGRYMNNRTIGKCHQNVLVFYKGDTKEIKNIYPEIEIEDESTDE